MYVYVNFLCFYVRYKKISKYINQKQDIKMSTVKMSLRKTFNHRYE